MVVAVFKIVSFVTAAYSGILHVTKESCTTDLNRGYGSVGYGYIHVVEWLHLIFCNLETRVRT